MTVRGMVTACVAGLALATASPVLAAGPKSHVSGNSANSHTRPAKPGSNQRVQGVVQSLTLAAVVVKQLDGTTVNVPFDRKTVFFVNRKPAHPADVKPGYVLVATWKAG